MSLVISLTVEGVVRKLSTEGVAGVSYFYDPLIISAPSLSLAYPDSGGYIKPSYGNAVFSPDLFTSKPEDTLSGSIYWMDRETLSETILYTGTFVLVSIGRDEVVYSIREHNFEVNLLDDGVDQYGNTVPKPLAMGKQNIDGFLVPHFPAQRTTDVSGTATYYKSGGLLSTGLLLYDDMLDVTSSCTDRSPSDPYGTVSRTTGTVAATMYVIPINNSIYTLAQLITYIAGKLGVSVSYPSSYSTKYLIKYVKDQIKAIDFLDKVCGFYGQVFYLSGDLSTITFVDRSTADTDPIILDSFDFFEAPINGKRLIKKILTKSENAHIVETDPTDANITRVVHKEYTFTVSGDDYGDDISVEIFTDLQRDYQARASVESKLSNLLSLWQKPWASVTLPIDNNIYAIGRDIIVVDNTFVVTLSTVIKILNISFDFDNETVTYSGPSTNIKSVDISAAENTDRASFSSAIKVLADLETTDSQDTTNFVIGYINSSIETTESQDSCFASADIIVQAELEASEAQDSVYVDSASIYTTISTIEQPDVFGFNATIVVESTLTTTEIQDSANVDAMQISVVLAAEEPVDSSDFSVAINP